MDKIEEEEPWSLDQKRDAYLKQVCAECGFRLGLHQYSDDRCPISENSMYEYRLTTFRMLESNKNFITTLK